MTQAERNEEDSTFYVKRAGAIGALKAIARLGLRHPGRFLTGLRITFKLGGLDARRILLCLFYFAEAAILSEWMRKCSLSHLHVHFASQAATVALILTVIAPINFSMMVHGPDEFYDVSSYYLEEKVAAARFVACISFFAQSQLMKLSSGSDWHKFDIARLGVDCSHFVPRPFRVSPETFEILCVGRLVSTKGQRILIQAAEQLISQGRMLKLRFVGDGPDRTELEHIVTEQGLSEKIRFEGSMNQDQIQAFYRQADIFALASFAEGIPVVLMEAMAMEIPCVATAINGIPELIRDGIDGLLVAPSDANGLAAAMARLMDESELRESLGKAGRQRVLENYEISASANRLRDVFQGRLKLIQ
jgi:glycosyltransferase involved in cell wall biosynthesis